MINNSQKILILDLGFKFIILFKSLYLFLCILYKFLNFEHINTKLYNFGLRLWTLYLYIFCNL